MDNIPDSAQEALDNADRVLAGEKPNIVKVRYFTEDGEAVSFKEYTYFSEDKLNLGDIVIVPVRDTTAKARVSSIDVSEDDVKGFRDKVKTIPAGSSIRPEQVEMEEGLNSEGLTLRAITPEVKQGIAEAIEQRTAIVKLTSEDIAKVHSLIEEVDALVKWSDERVIDDPDSVKDATADLSISKNLSKSIEEIRQVYIAPLNADLKMFNDFFKRLSEPVTNAIAITKKKILEYNAEVERKRREAERIEEEKYRLAQDEARLKGEHTVDLTPVDKPDETPSTVRTDAGDAHKTGTWKYKVIDFASVPDDYKMIDSSMLTAIARKHHDQKPVPGIEFYFEPGLRVNARR